MVSILFEKAKSYRVVYKLGLLGYFVLKNQSGKIYKIHIFELHQVFMYNFCVKLSEHSRIIYCLQEKSKHFDLEVPVKYVISSVYVLNCFKYFLIYILGQNSSNNQTRKTFKLYQVSMCWIVLNILGQHF